MPRLKNISAKRARVSALNHRVVVIVILSPEPHGVPGLKSRMAGLSTAMYLVSLGPTGLDTAPGNPVFWAFWKYLQPSL
jgi:hypothetical protein